MNDETEIRQQAEGAIARLRLLAVADMQGADEQELIGLAALAVGPVADPERRHALAEALIGALTILRFAPVFGTDIRRSRKQVLAMLDEVAAAPTG